MLLLFAFAATSCKKSFINLAPPDQISEANFYQTEADFRQALAMSYVTLRAVANNDFYLTEMRSDNTDYDYDPTDVGTANVFRRNIHDWVDDATDSYTQTMYTDIYVGISRANIVLSRLYAPAASGIDTSVKSEIRGEAEFLRAFYYFRLVRFFGGVPLSLQEVTTADQAFLPRTSADSVYMQIVSDASDAINSLPVVTFTAGQQSGAATKGAATMLLADVYMTQNNYAGAEALLTTLSGMGYSLLPTYASVFSTANKNSVESIFEVQYTAGTGSQQSDFIYLFLPLTANTALITNGVVTDNTIGSWNVPTQDLLNAYEPGDTRLDASVGVAEGTWNASYIFTISAYKSIINYTPAPGKVGRPFDKKVLNPVTIADNTDDDWPIYRYADALLLLAEAQNEQGKSAQALTSLNVVRQRAFGDAAHNITVTDQTSLRTAIAHERRVELGFENHRWFDLLRTGTAVSVMTTFGAQLKLLHTYLPANTMDIQPYRLLYPIPSSERNLNPALTQNPGYTF
jgi:hypothetical protein